MRNRHWGLALLAAATFGAPARSASGETLNYEAEWRFIRAGTVQLTWSPADPAGEAGYSARLLIRSAGLVSRLFKVDNEYTSRARADLCAVSSLLKTNEGSRRRETRVTFDSARRKASTYDRDLVKNIETRTEIDTGPCELDVIGALYRLRALRLEPGHSAEIPVSDGRKAVSAKVTAQERETIRTDAGSFKTIRYEAFLFDGVLYRRRGRLFIWLTDDERRLPVQIRIRLPFYIGTVTLALQKEGKT